MPTALKLSDELIDLAKPRAAAEHRSATFARVVKKLHARSRSVVDSAVKEIASDPVPGDEKRETSPLFLCTSSS